jgi:protein SCO1/2
MPFLRFVSSLLACLLLGIATAVPAAPASAFKAGVFEPPRQAPEFALPGSDGSELTLARYRGKVVLMSFGFTHCAAVCPVTLATLAQTRSALGSAADAVQVVFVTVDPERDPAPRLKAYLAAFHASFVGATGKPEQLAAMRKGYGVVASKVPMADGYAMDHTSSVFLIDREGRLRAMMPYGHDAKDFVHDVKLLLAK